MFMIFVILAKAIGRIARDPADVADKGALCGGACQAPSRALPTDLNPKARKLQRLFWGRAAQDARTAGRETPRRRRPDIQQNFYVLFGSSSRR